MNEAYEARYPNGEQKKKFAWVARNGNYLLKPVDAPTKSEGLIHLPGELNKQVCFGEVIVAPTPKAEDVVAAFKLAPLPVPLPLAVEGFSESSRQMYYSAMMENHHRLLDALQQSAAVAFVGDVIAYEERSAIKINIDGESYHVVSSEAILLVSSEARERKAKEAFEARYGKGTPGEWQSAEERLREEERCEEERWRRAYENSKKTQEQPSAGSPDPDSEPSL